MKAYMSTGQHGDGLTPHDRERLTRMAFEEARRILADVEPRGPMAQATYSLPGGDGRAFVAECHAALAEALAKFVAD